MNVSANSQITGIYVTIVGMFLSWSDFFLVISRLQHQDKPRPDSSWVLGWRVRGASPNCVCLPMVTYSIGGPPQTHPDQSQLHRHQYKHCAPLELPRTVDERGREATKCIHGTSAISSKNTFNDPKGLLPSSQFTCNKRPPVHVTCRANKANNFAKDIREGKQDATK